MVSKNIASQKEIAECEKGNAEQTIAVDGMAKDADSSLTDGEQDFPTHTNEKNIQEINVDAISMTTAGGEAHFMAVTSAGSVAEKQINEKAKECVKTEQEAEKDEGGKGEEEEEGEEANEEAGMDEGAEGSRDEDVTVVSPIEEAQGVSVVASTHDISSETDFRRLTESELQLGKVRSFNCILSGGFFS
uniref:Prothymosin alpha-like n=1 Tax=Ascaris lumbricoides TaxID=6252 RepID=A0A0M3HH84_ASCLU